MKKNKVKILFCLIFIVLGSSVVLAKEGARNFTDVSKEHWAYEAVHELHSLGITQGVGHGEFGMGRTITRNEFVTFLTKLMQWELVAPDKGSFIDNVDTTKWYYAPVETALQHGVLSKDMGWFRGEESITREEMAVMLVRTLGYETLANQLTYLGSPFEDVTQNTGYITIAKDFGIITGVGNHMFKPYDTAKREEAAVMMMRMYDKLQHSIHELHGFYAIRSALQADMIPAFDSIGFGWSRLEYDEKNNQVILNTTRKNDNEYAIPAGFSQPLEQAKEQGASTQLMVLAKDDWVVNLDTKSRVLLVEYIVTNPEVRKQVIGSILSQINGAKVDDGTIFFDGVVIDFENMKGDLLRDSFTLFLQELKKELEKNNKLLYVAVHPKRRHGQAYYDGYDYKAIGEVADKVILMAHDYYAKELTDTEMESGYTITPLTPMNEFYYALKSITDKQTGVEDVTKVWIQFSFDSVQWKLKDGKVIHRFPYHPSYEGIQQRLIKDEVMIHYSDVAQNSYATFFDSQDETHNVIWYEDVRSIEAKINIMKMFDIQGISLWRLGNIPNFTDIESKKTYLNVWEKIRSIRKD